RVIDIALKDLRITLKDKRALAMIMLMPIALIFVLGMGLSSAFKSDGGNIKQFDVAVIDKDQGILAENFKSFLEIDGIKKLINAKYMNYEDAEGKVKNGEIPAMIVIPEGASAAMEKGNQVELQIVEDSGSSLKANIVRSLVKSFADSASAVYGAQSSAGTVLSDYKFNGTIDTGRILSMLNDNGTGNFKENTVEGQKVVSAMQYYSAAMLVMFILSVAMMGTSSVIQEREEKTLLRLMGTTVSKRTVLTGKLLGLFLIGVLDVSVLIVFTSYIFDTDWGNSLGGIIVLSAALLFAACGFAMFIATLFKTAKGVQGASSPIVMVMSFLGGSMFPIYSMPDAMQTAAKIVPNNWGLRGYISLMLGNGMGSIVTPALVLTAFGAVMLVIGIFRLRLD
ncbi:MAG: ABC transporter permease, partial [Bacillota bacterium]|nr:ABC transporter permease [Bacillota bacterium]